MADKTWTPETIAKLIHDSTKMVERSLLVLYSRQTEGEQHAETTCETNHMGFTGADANLLSSFAKQIIKSQRTEGQRLSPKQLFFARKKLPKYAKQLATYANNKEALEIERALGVASTELFKKGGTFTPLEAHDGSN